MTFRGAATVSGCKLPICNEEIHSSVLNRCWRLTVLVVKVVIWFPNLIVPRTLDTSSFKRYPFIVRQLLRLIQNILVEGRTEYTTVILLPPLLRSSVFTSSREDYHLFSAVLLFSLSLRDCGTLPEFAGSAHRRCILHPRIALGQALLPLALSHGETQLSS